MEMHIIQHSSRIESKYTKQSGASRTLFYRCDRCSRSQFHECHYDLFDEYDVRATRFLHSLSILNKSGYLEMALVDKERRDLEHSLLLCRMAFLFSHRYCRA